MIFKKRHISFAVIGACNFIVDFVIFWLLLKAGVYVVLANMISTFIAFISSFIFNRKYTFGKFHKNVSCETIKKRSVYAEFVLYFVITFFGLWVIQPVVILLFSALIYKLFSKVIDFIVMHWFFGILHMASSQRISSLIAKVIATGVTMVWNYILYNKYVFNKR